MELSKLTLFLFIIVCVFISGLKARCSIVKDYVNLKGQATLTVLAPLHGPNCSQVKPDILALVEIIRWNVVTFNEASSFKIGLQVLNTCSETSFIPTLTLSSWLMTGSSFNLGILSLLSNADTLQVSRIAKPLNVVLFTPTQDYDADTSILSWYVYYRRPLVQIAVAVAKRLGNQVLFLYSKESGYKEVLTLALKDACVTGANFVLKDMEKIRCAELVNYSVVLHGQQVFDRIVRCNSTGATFILINFPESSVVKEIAKHNAIYVVEEILPSTKNISRNLRNELQNTRSWLSKYSGIWNGTKLEAYEALLLPQPRCLPTFLISSHILQAFRQAQQWNCRGDTPLLCNQLNKMPTDHWRQLLMNSSYTIPISEDFSMHDRIGSINKNISYEVLSYRRKHAAFERVGTYRDGYLNLRFNLNITLTLNNVCTNPTLKPDNSSVKVLVDVKNETPSAETDIEEFTDLNWYYTITSLTVLSLGTLLSLAFNFRQVFY